MASQLSRSCHRGFRTRGCSSDGFRRRIFRAFDAAAGRNFCKAIRESSVPVILPTFLQSASQGGHKILENLPLPPFRKAAQLRSEEHTSELQSLMRISYAVFCLKKTTIKYTKH